MLSLLDALGLVLAEDLRADRDFPPFPRSTRDGFAVRAADVAASPARLRCVGEIKAGAAVEQSAIKIAAGETAEIMTGAPVPCRRRCRRDGGIHRAQRRRGDRSSPGASRREHCCRRVGSPPGRDHGHARDSREPCHRGHRRRGRTRRDRGLSPAARCHSGHRRRTGRHQPAARPQRNSQFQQLLAGRPGLCRWR